MLTNPDTSKDFVRDIVEQDISSGKHKTVITRFPPEPNGYLHIGHATSICLNFGIAMEHPGGKCNLRFDDTNPTRESMEFVNSIKEDLNWLGFDWGEQDLYASDYFSQLYSYAIKLIKQDKAYVDSQTHDEIRINRGTLTSHGAESPYRNRTIEDNLTLFSRMKAGDFEEGSHVLRAKIDMTSPNINMRDPVIYRILEVPHHQTGTEWSIYPMYDFAHSLSDSIEQVTHSLCTMEYEDHRPLYEWFLNQLEVFKSRQIEFAKFNVSHTVLSKRNLLKLVNNKHVDGWDDPRMPTISGMRRLGYTPSAIKDFCQRVSITRRDNTTSVGLLEHCVRQDLNKNSNRVMAVLNPIKVILLNYPDNKTEYLEAMNNPEDTSAGTRQLPFAKELYIESDDFMENPPNKFYRLSPGKEVRLRYGYFIKCIGIIKDEDTGNVSEIHCTYDPETRGGSSPDGRKVRATIHWVSAKHSVSGEVRLYDRLCIDENPVVNDDTDLSLLLNPDSLIIMEESKLEPSLSEARKGDRYQFERLGYFCADSKDSDKDSIVFNRTITLRDTWKKIQRSNP